MSSCSSYVTRAVSDLPLTPGALRRPFSLGVAFRLTRLAAALAAVAACQSAESGASATDSDSGHGDAHHGAPDSGDDSATPGAGDGDDANGLAVDGTVDGASDAPGDGEDPDGAADGTEADYAALFDGDVVRTITVSITAEDVAAMTADMNELAGEFGVGGFGPGGGGPGGGIPGGGIPDGAIPDGGIPDGGFPGGGPPGGGGGAIDLLARDPMWVPATVTYGDVTLEHVGFRYKGNSSLASSWSAGISKLPFRLDFDKFEDERPSTKNQRLHGFRKLTFSPGYSDASYLRDTLAGEVFADAGVPSARTAFYRVMLDVGEDPVYAGLYTVIEDPSDVMMERIFGDRDRNLYKPDGTGADWTVFNEAGFEKKNNEKVADFSDVESAITALHSDRTDADAWRAGLEATFDVSGFLRYLAVNTAIVNWDTYGAMAHNYYLYNDGVLVWIPWDNNMSLGSDLGMGGSNSVLYENTTDQWPLIRFLLDDVVYLEMFKDELSLTLQGAYDIDAFSDRAEELHALIEPHVLEEVAPYTQLTSAAAFSGSVADLIDHVTSRHAAIKTAIDADP
ncbi:MAG: CotH kinase family protein [Myxococcales bacterium]|nr:CotH kinase family protein [Myxococcales bacterium]